MTNRHFSRKNGWTMRFSLLGTKQQKENAGNNAAEPLFSGRAFRLRLVRFNGLFSAFFPFRT